MKRPIALIFIVLSFLSPNIEGQNHVSFFEEHIDFQLDKGYFIVNGIFSFYNKDNQTVNQRIVFPFADKATEIDSIRIVNLNTHKRIQFKRLDSSVSFDFMLLPNDTVDLNIYYRQKISTVNKYIITSTQSWKRPLDKAVYTLTTAKNLTIKSFSYKPDSMYFALDKKVYVWEKRQFMPSVEFDITIN